MECKGVSLFFNSPPPNTPIILDTGNVKVSWGKVYITDEFNKNEFIKLNQIYKVLKNIRDGTDEEIPSYSFLNTIVSYLSEYIADNIPSAVLEIKTKNIVTQTDISISDKPSFKEILKIKKSISTQTIEEQALLKEELHLKTEESARDEQALLKEEELKEEVLKIQSEYAIMKKEWLKMKKTIDNTKKNLEKANKQIEVKDKALKEKRTKERTSEIFTDMIKKHDFNYIDLSFIMLNARIEETIKTIVIWQMFYMRSISKKDMELNKIIKVNNFFDFWDKVMIPVLEKFKQPQIQDLIEEWKVMYILITKEDAKVDISPETINNMFWCLCHRFKHRCQAKSFYPPFFTMLSEMCLNLEKLYELISYWENNKGNELVVKETVKLFMYNTHFNLLAKYSEELDKKDLKAIFEIPDFLPE